MNDHELLELAAKARGFSNGPYDFDPKTGWNPLVNDGDALRLAVKLGISMETEANIEVYRDEVGGEYRRGVEAWHVATNASSTIAEEIYGLDPYAATRRAIVRAAAEIGKSLP